MSFSPSAVSNSASVGALDTTRDHELPRADRGALNVDCVVLRSDEGFRM